MTVLLSDLFIRNSLLIIGLIYFIEGAALGSRCKCPKRKEIQLSEENDKAIIFSPNYPRPYCAGLSCEWKILALSNSSLLRFSSPKIDLRPHRDHIYFYDSSNGSEPAHSCTGRIKNCEFVSNGPVLRIRFVTSKGTVDKYGFQATLILFDDEFQSLSDDEDLDSPIEQKSSAWNFFVWAVLICVVIFILAAAIYWLCKKQRASEENRSPLLEKSSKREDSVHLSLNSPPDELNDLNDDKI